MTMRVLNCTTLCLGVYQGAPVFTLTTAKGKTLVRLLDETWEDAFVIYEAREELPGLVIEVTDEFLKYYEEDAK